MMETRVQWQKSLAFIQFFHFSRRMAVTRFKLMSNILANIALLRFSQYSRNIVSRCLSDVGGDGLDYGFIPGRL